MKDLTRRISWPGLGAAILLLVAFAAVVWLIGTNSPAAGSTRPAASPSATIEYRLAQVKTATPLPAATARVAATSTRAPTPTLVPTLPAPPTSQVVASLAQVPRISVAAARDGVAAGTAVFVDVRTEATYQHGHLPGALSLPAALSAGGYDELRGDKLLIFYCA